MSIDKMKPLLAVLVMSEGLPELKLALLEVICERFPAQYGTVDSVDVSFSCTSQSVSPLGFMLLEEVELTSGDFPNLEVARVSVERNLRGGKLVLALSKRLSCQKEQPSEVQVRLDGYVICDTAEEAEAFSTIVQCCKNTSYEGFIVGMGLGEIGQPLGGWQSCFGHRPA